MRARWLKTVIRWLCRATVWAGAAYGAAVFYQNYLMPAPRPQYPTEFLAGIHEIGPRTRFTLSQAWQLLALGGKYTSSKWRLFEFVEAQPNEPSHFLVIWTREDYPLIAFRLADLTVERVEGPVPKEFHVAPGSTNLASFHWLEGPALLAAGKGN